MAQKFMNFVSDKYSW